MKTAKLLAILHSLGSLGQILVICVSRLF